MMTIQERRVPANGIEIQVAECGKGPSVLLLHGWPHTWRLWQDVMPRLAEAGYHVLAPDLRGLGGSTRAASGYDLHTLGDDAVALLDALGVEDVMVAGIDASAPVAFMLAMRHPGRVRKLALSESLIGDLPGAEKFLSRGAPWWFGFHAIPGFAERIVDGREDAYIGWFLSEHSRKPIPSTVRDAFIEAYRGQEALRCGFEYYRAFPERARQIRESLAVGNVSQPVLALVGGMVGDAIYDQLVPIAPQLFRVDVPESFHLVPLEQPELCAAALIAFERGQVAT